MKLIVMLRIPQLGELVQLRVEPRSSARSFSPPSLWSDIGALLQRLVFRDGNRIES